RPAAPFENDASSGTSRDLGRIVGTIAVDRWTVGRSVRENSHAGRNRRDVYGYLEANGRLELRCEHPRFSDRTGKRERRRSSYRSGHLGPIGKNKSIVREGLYIHGRAGANIATPRPIELTASGNTDSSRARAGLPRIWTINQVDEYTVSCLK